MSAGGAAGPVHVSGSLPNQAEPGKFRRRNFAHTGPDLNKTELAGIHHPVDSRTTDPGGLAEFGNADADARDRCMRPWSAPLLPDWGMVDRHWEPPLSRRSPLSQKKSVGTSGIKSGVKNFGRQQGQQDCLRVLGLPYGLRQFPNLRGARVQVFPVEGQKKGAAHG